MYKPYADYAAILGPADPQDGYEPSKIEIGECAECGDLLTVSRPGYRDEEGNGFCSSKCAREYHGIRKMDKDDIDYFMERNARYE